MSRFVQLDETGGRAVRSLPGAAAGGVKLSGGDDGGGGSDLRLDYESLPLHPTASQVATVRKHGTLPFVAIVDIEESAAELQGSGIEAGRPQRSRPRDAKVVLVGVISRDDLDDCVVDGGADSEDCEQPSPCAQQYEGRQGDGQSEDEDSLLLALGGSHREDSGVAKASGRLRQLIQATSVHSVAMHTSVGQLQLYFSRLGVELAYVVSAGALQWVVSSQQVAVQPPA